MKMLGIVGEVRRLSPIPLLSIIEKTRDVAAQRGIRIAGLLGTRFTMTARFYRDVFEPADTTLVVPNEEEQRFVHDSYMNELIGGNVVAASSPACASARQSKPSSTRIHVDAAIREMLA
jgi:aspartate racemase